MFHLLTMVTVSWVLSPGGPSSDFAPWCFSSGCYFMGSNILGIWVRFWKMVGFGSWIRELLRQREPGGQGGFSCLDMIFLCPFSAPSLYKPLIQCGQPQCYTHILQWLKNESQTLLIDAVTYLVALIPEPLAGGCGGFNTARVQQSRPYALCSESHDQQVSFPLVLLIGAKEDPACQCCLYPPPLQI